MKLLPQVLQEKQILEPDHRVLLWLGDKGIEQKSYTYRQVSICGVCVAIIFFAQIYIRKFISIYRSFWLHAYGN